MTNEELQAHVKAILEWAKSEDRTAFVVCADFTEDGMVMDAGISGSAPKAPYALYKAMGQHDAVKGIVCSAARAADSSIGEAVLELIADVRSGKPKSGHSEDLNGLKAKFKDWFCKK